MRVHVTMLLLVIAFFSVESRTGCDRPWKRYGSKCYAVFHQAQCFGKSGKTYCARSDFKHKCKNDHSATLAIVKSSKVAYFISRRAQTSSIVIDGKCTNQPFVDKFGWSDGTVVDMKKFSKGKPEKNGFKCCMEMYKKTRKFNNIKCSSYNWYRGIKRTSYDYACMKFPRYG